MFRSFLNWNVAAARAINRLLPETLRTDGNYWFRDNVLGNGFRSGDVVFDLGGGSRPWFSVEEKQRLALTVVGLDISAHELNAAPAGSYDEIIEADLCNYASSPQQADKVICQATLEHVPDTAGALRSIANILKPGGTAYIFCPCRNALFAWLNRSLGQETKTKLLGTLFPYATEGHDGFPAPYDRCTPSEITSILKDNQMTVVSLKTFWVSGYFYVFLPAYVTWRLYQGVSWLTRRDDGCEAFCIVAEKQARAGGIPHTHTV